jgi:hypothetical protein
VCYWCGDLSNGCVIFITTDGEHRLCVGCLFDKFEVCNCSNNNFVKPVNLQPQPEIIEETHEDYHFLTEDYKPIYRGQIKSAYN